MILPSDFNGQKGSEAGFTLLELLVAMTLLGLLTVLLLGGLHFGTRVWERSDNHLSKTSNMQLVTDLLRREIGFAYPYFDTKKAVTSEVLFRGTAHSLSFLGPAPLSLNFPGRARISLEAVERPQGIALQMTAVPELLLEGQKGPSAETLLKDLRAVSFAYFGTNSLESSPEWSSDWENARSLPLLVRIRVEDTSGKWPDLIIKPSISVDVGCVYDPLTKYCRGR